MKITFSIPLIIIFLFSFLWTENKQNVDSKIAELTLKLSKAKVKDMPAIYNKLAGIYGDTGKDIEKIKLYAEKAIESAKKNKQPDQHAYGLRNMARYFWWKKQMDRVEPLLLEAAAIAEPLADQRVLIEVLDYLSQFYSVTNENRKDLDLYKRLLKLSFKIKDKKLIAEYTHYMASTYLEHGAVKKAFETYSLAIERYKQCNDWRHVVQLMSYIGGFNENFGNRQKAIDILNSALKIGLEKKYQVESCRVYEKLGYIYANMKDFKRSESHFKKAIDVAKGHTWASIISTSSIIDLYIEMENLKAADRYLEELIELNKMNKTTSKPYFDIEIQYYKGGLLYLQKKFKLAESAYVNVLNKTKYKPLRLRVHLSLYKLFLHKNHKNKALNQLEMALENAKKLKNIQKSKSILQKIIHIYKQKKDEKSVQKFEKKLREIKF